jgi:hypothetical protein
MDKYRQAALLIQRSKYSRKRKRNSSVYSILFSGIRGHFARKQYKQIKLTKNAYQNEVQKLCAGIEEMNNQLVTNLNQLNDKLPGLTFVDKDCL